MACHRLAAVPLDLPLAAHSGAPRAEGKTAEAIDASLQLLVPPQQRLPDELESAVQEAIAAWESGEPLLAGVRLGEAVELAQLLRYP
jgi:hypothetical protein